MSYINVDKLRSLVFKTDKRSIVLISIDFELTWNTKEITEVGLSILNLDHISSTTLATPVSTLSYVDTLADHIESYHLRTARYYTWINLFPPGSNPSGFGPQFGNSEKVSAARLVRRMKEIMWGSGTDKTYILVGCALSHEHNSLANLAFDLAPIEHEIDIQVEDRSIRGRSHHGSLHKICAKLRLSPQNLHNAGNDARYTLECLLRMLMMDSVQKRQYALDPTSAVLWTDIVPTASTEKQSNDSAQNSPISQNTEWLITSKSAAIDEVAVHDSLNTTNTVNTVNIMNNQNKSPILNTGDNTNIINTTDTTKTTIHIVTNNKADAIIVPHATSTTDTTDTANFTAATTTADGPKTTNLADVTNITTTRTATSNNTKQSKKKNMRQRQQAKKQAEAARQEKIQSLYSR